MQDGEEVFQVANLLVVDKNVGVLHYSLHLIGVGNKVAREVTSIKLHTLYNADACFAALAFFDGDNAVFANLTHGISKKFSYFGVVVGTYRGHLFNLVVVVVYLFGCFADVIYNNFHSLVDTAFQIHWVCASRYVLQALVNNGLRKNSSSGCTVASIVARFRCNTLYELCTRVFEVIFQLNFLCNGNSVFGNLRCTEFLFNHHVATFWAKRNFNGVSQFVYTIFKQVACFYIEFNFFCHLVFTIELLYIIIRSRTQPTVSVLGVVMVRIMRYSPKCHTGKQ